MVEDRIQPPGSGPWPAAILYMDAMAVRPNLKSMAERFASNGYVVLLPNLFYRAGAIPPVDAAAFVTPGPERERVFGLIQSLDGPKVMSDTQAMLAYLDTQPMVKGKIGTVGYCMGGGYALRAAGTFPDRVAAAASFHGGGLATDAPDSPHSYASRIKAKVYIGVAAIDPMFPDEERERLRKALADAGVDFTLEVYPDVRHGFTVTGHPVYDAAASERHWDELLKLFSATLGV
jgi:carboxymethylenebutenolidase